MNGLSKKQLQHLIIILEKDVFESDRQARIGFVDKDGADLSRELLRIARNRLSSIGDNKKYVL